jgi:phosphoribosylformylglycinamidine synthase subunit PurSL
LFAESASRILVTVAPQDTAAFEAIFNGQVGACIGEVTETDQLVVLDTDDNILLELNIADMQSAFVGGLD